MFWLPALAVSVVILSLHYLLIELVFRHLNTPSKGLLWRLVVAYAVPTIGTYFTFLLSIPFLLSGSGPNLAIAFCVEFFVVLYVLLVVLIRPWTRHMAVATIALWCAVFSVEYAFYSGFVASVFPEFDGEVLTYLALPFFAITLPVLLFMWKYGLPWKTILKRVVLSLAGLFVAVVIVMVTTVIVIHYTGSAATIDPTSFQSSSGHPTITGTAKGVDSVFVTLMDKNEAFWHSNLVPVQQGKWSVVASPDYTLPPGTYTLFVSAPNNPQNLDPALVAHSLVIVP